MRLIFFSEPVPFFETPCLVACQLSVFPLSTGGHASVPWTFVQEARLQADYPAYCCPAVVVHGLCDDVVPADVTRSLVEGRIG